MIAIPTRAVAIQTSSTGAGRSPVMMPATTPTAGTRKRDVPRFAGDVRPRNQSQPSGLSDGSNRAGGQVVAAGEGPDAVPFSVGIDTDQDLIEDLDRAHPGGLFVAPAATVWGGRGGTLSGPGARLLSHISGAIKHDHPVSGIIRMHPEGIGRDGPELHGGRARQQRPHQLD